MNDVDVLVVGAGPAGSSCAAIVAEAGYNVHVLEKRQSIGEPLQCGEYIPKLFLRELNITKDFIENEISSLRTHIDFTEFSETKTPGYMINRIAFDRALSLDAIRKGAKINIGVVAVSLTDGTVMAKTSKGMAHYRAKFIVGADGPASTVGRWMDSRNSTFNNTYQIELLKKGDSAISKVYFFDECPAGYGWLFPKASTFNLGVGVGITFKKNPLRVLEFMLDRLQLRKNSGIRFSKGLIPTGGILDTLVKHNMLLVGDAAGLVHAITGAGIPQAVISGKLAGRIIVKALAENNSDVLKEYEYAILELWGSYIGTSVRKREFMDARWGKEPLETIIKQTWVAFQEYHSEA